MVLLNMIWVFFKVGLFTIGGGLVAIPIMQDYSRLYGWVSDETFANMIAISQSTPGPIGINMATYVGFTQYGILGSVLVTFGIVLPSYIIIVVIEKFMSHINEYRGTETFFSTIRPVVVGVILSAAFTIATTSFINIEVTTTTFDVTQAIDLKSFVTFCIFFLVILKVKLHPVVYIGAGGIIGIFLF